jgi:hypothetical protein
MKIIQNHTEDDHGDDIGELRRGQHSRTGEVLEDSFKWWFRRQ